MLPHIAGDHAAAEALQIAETGGSQAGGSTIGSQELSYLPLTVQAACLALSRLYVRPPPAEVVEILEERREAQELLDQTELAIAQGLEQRKEKEAEGGEEEEIETGPPNGNVFASIMDDLASPGTGLKAWATDFAPEETKMPMSWRELESLPFLKFLLVVTLRPTRVVFAVRRLLEEIVPSALAMLIEDGRASVGSLIADISSTAMPTTVEKRKAKEALTAAFVPKPPTVVPIIFLLDPMEERHGAGEWSEPAGLDAVALGAVLKRQAFTQVLELHEAWPHASRFAHKGVMSTSERRALDLVDSALINGHWALLQVRRPIGGKKRTTLLPSPRRTNRLTPARPRPPPQLVLSLDVHLSLSLQNVHRASKQWLAELSAKFDFLDTHWDSRGDGTPLTSAERTARRTCRLMLSASPRAFGVQIPRALLSRCEVLSVGTALGLGEGQGLRPTLHGTWSAISPEAWTQSLGAGGGGTVLEGDGDGSCSMADGMDAEGHRILYGVALLHATFRERRTAFGAAAGGGGLSGGGRRAFLASVEAVRKACLGLGSARTTSTEIKVVADALGLLRYAVGEAILGGRLVAADGAETRLLRTLVGLVLRSKTLYGVVPNGSGGEGGGGGDGREKGHEALFMADARDFGLITPPPSLRLPNPNADVAQGASNSAWWRKWSGYISDLLPGSSAGTPIELQLPLSAEPNAPSRARRGYLSLAAAGALAAVTPRLLDDETRFSNRCWETAIMGGVEEEDEPLKEPPAWSVGDALESSVALLVDLYDTPHGWLWIDSGSGSDVQGGGAAPAGAEGDGAAERATPMVYRDIEALVDEQLAAIAPSTAHGATPSQWSTEMGPWGFVWRQETVAMQALSRRVRRDIHTLEAALSGLACLAPAERAVAAALRAGEVPAAWIARSGPSQCTLPEWAERQQKRFLQIRIVHGAMSAKSGGRRRGGSRSVADDLPSIAPPAPLVTWLPGLFSPRRFIAALRQAAARRVREEERMRLLVRYEGVLAGNITETPGASTSGGVAKSSSRGDATPDDGDENRGVAPLPGADHFIVVGDIQKRRIEEIVNKSDKGAFVYGVALAGARWDRSALEMRRARPDDTVDVLPPLLIRAVSPGDHRPARYTAELPLYRTAQRGAAQHVMNVDVRISGRDPASSAAKWVLQSAFLTLDVAVEEK
jgi:hypothetical protein